MKNDIYAVERALRAGRFGAMLGGAIVIGAIASLICLMRALDGVWPRFDLALARDFGAWMIIGPLGLGLVFWFAVVPLRLRSAAVLVGLAGALSAGLFLLEDLASPFGGAIHTGGRVMNEVLFVLSDG